MAGILGVPDWKLKKFIANNKLGTKRPTLSNPKAFSNPKDPKANYWAGFIAADGCVDLQGRIRFYLQLEDHHHLKKFAEFVGSTHRINRDPTRNRCSIEFTCSDMVKDLAVWGITPNKSITYTPTSLCKNKEFIRGLFDGDGTICESFSNTNSTTATLYTGIACSYPCRDWLSWLWEYLDISIKQHERTNHVTITMNTNKSKTFLVYMYENSCADTRLTRKYDLYVKTVVNNNRKIR